MGLEIIAELHPQHGGSMVAIREMIREAKRGGADVAKFQLYDAAALLGAEWEYLELSREETGRIKEWCDEEEIEFMASVFDEERLEWIEALGVARHKIASGAVKNDPALCERVLGLGKPTIVSLGHWHGPEKPFGESDRIDYLHCKSLYPALLEDMGDFPADFAAQGLAGYSDHTLGLDVCLLAVARGARVIEKHFTLDKMRTRPTEKAHICSMTPPELAELRRVGGSMARTRRALEDAAGDAA
jgi:sialic acid synthase SpsE